MAAALVYCGLLTFELFTGYLTTYQASKSLDGFVCPAGEGGGQSRFVHRPGSFDLNIFVLCAMIDVLTQ
jgi:hypothetical protein